MPSLTRSARVPSVAMSSHLSSRRPCANGTRPFGSETESRTRTFSPVARCGERCGKRREYSHPVPLGLDLFLRRLSDPFDPESRFYWPLAIAVFAAIVANTVWYYWRPDHERPSPTETALRPWVYWVNVIFCLWYLVLLIAKVPFYWFAGSLLVNIASILFLYAYWLPPR